MNVPIFRRDTCRLCGSTDLELVLPLAASPIGDDYIGSDRLAEVQQSYPRDLFLCKNCGYVHLRDVIDPKILYSAYIYTTSSSLGLSEHFKNYANEVVERVNPGKNSLVVDIGCNDGTLLRHFQEKGLQPIGVDPAASHVAQDAMASGIKMFSTFFTPEVAHQIQKEFGSATIVTTNNTFANIDDLDEMTQGIYALLAADGVFVLEFAYLVDLLERDIFDYIYHEHLSYFSVKSLVPFFRRHNLEFIDIKRVPTKGGSLRCILQRIGGSRTVSPSVQELIDLETKLGVDRPETYEVFAAKIDQIKTRLLECLKALQSQGKIIAAYGASITCTSLIYDCGLGEFISFIVDDNPLRYNLFSPGHHIPVFPSQVLYERKPDYTLILAWRFADPILKRHQTYLQEGGHFIIPIPELEVI